MDARPSEAGPVPQTPYPPQKRKRLPRATVACDMCRVRKAKCDQKEPRCSHCTRYGFECTYLKKTQYDRPKRFHAHRSRVGTEQLSESTGHGSYPSPMASNSFDNVLPRSDARLSQSSATTTPAKPHPEHTSSQQSPSDFATAAWERDVLRKSSSTNRQLLEPIRGSASRDRSLILVDTPVSRSDDPRHQSDDCMRTHQDLSKNSVAEINNYTTGTEYFGPSGTFPFLVRLLDRSQVLNRHDYVSEPGHTQAGNRKSPLSVPPSRSPVTGDELSIVNFLYNQDYHVSTRAHTPEQYPLPTTAQAPDQDPPTSRAHTTAGASVSIPQQRPDHDQPQSTNPNGVQLADADGSLNIFLTSRRSAVPQALPIVSTEGSTSRKRKEQIEKHCINLYFSNLHLIHPILRKASFIARCEKEIWSTSTEPLPRSPQRRDRSKFLALYNAVCAVGAITAGDEPIFANGTTNAPESLNSASSDNGRPKKRLKTTYPQLKVARTFFEQAKLNLGDVFEICSLDSTQALFLMSVFCQNALKPHSCYMYSGMAARTALAIGITNEKNTELLADPTAAGVTWWYACPLCLHIRFIVNLGALDVCIYSHEMEMCCASGRDALLKPPTHYCLSLPLKDPDVNSSKAPTAIVTAMVSLAEILRAASDELYQPKQTEPLPQTSKLAFELDDMLQQWQQNLPPLLNLTEASLRDPEWLSKQKVVLKLRFWNARIILHRQFLILSAAHDLESYSRHVELCLDASRKTIHLLYDTYLHRYYFRTWWYNTTYTLYASMIILFIILVRPDRVNAGDLISDVEKSLEILRAMDTIHVAHGCAQLISEVLDIARRHISNSSTHHVDTLAMTPLGTPRVDLDQSGINQREASIVVPTGIFEGDTLTSLVDFNLLSDFSEFTDMDTLFTGLNQVHMGSREYGDGLSLPQDSEDLLRGGADGVLFQVSPGI